VKNKLQKTNRRPGPASQAHPGSPRALRPPSSELRSPPCANGSQPSASPYKPQEHCPSCDHLLPPLRSDDSRPDGWCAHCTTSLPHPHSLIEHCPHCGFRIPASDPGSGRRATICFQCARPLPPPAATSDQL